MNVENENNTRPVPVGRFAPSPTGRMHLGNITAALLSWLSVRSRGGRWILRIEDLDPQRSRREYALQIEDDLRWLGIDWDEGGTDGTGPDGPYSQSLRGEFYSRQLHRLEEMGLTYPCRCTRADIMSTQAPHESDGRVVYAGTCRPRRLGGTAPDIPAPSDRPPATRIFVPDETIEFTDLVCGPRRVNLAKECGDFVLRRGDGAWAYQLAVVVDDALMGITEVMRGNDLLVSAPQQIYLMRLLGLPVPQFAHLPLVCNAAGQRLSKRDASMSMEQLRRRLSPEEILGRIACLAGWQPDFSPVSLATLLARYRDPAPRPSVLLPETI